MNNPDVFIVAGEPSGDLIGSLMIRQLRKIDPDYRIAGIGGEKLAEAGVELRFNITRDLAIIGLAEVFTKFHKIQHIFRDTVRYLKRERPGVLVLIDYPGFNLRLAKQAHKLGIKVVYYVIPQVWAWHKSRVHQMREYVDRSLVVLPFEEPYLREAGANVEYVGHPLLDILIVTMGREEVFDKFGFDPGKRLIGILPGSRKREIESLLPIMLEAAEMIQARLPDTQFVLPKASAVSHEQIDPFLSAANIEIDVVESFRYNVRSMCDFAMVASGTATLETGLMLSPMAVMYKIAWPTWMIGKMLVDVNYIGLINIVADDLVVPELIQDQCTAQNVADHCVKILSDPREIEKVKYQLQRVKEKMGGPGASRRAAEVVAELCPRPRAESKNGPEAA